MNGSKKQYFYDYFGDINSLISKLKNEKYYQEYLIEYYNESSFSIGVGRTSHGSGVWYKATIERKDDKYIISGTLDTYPKKDNNKKSIWDIMTIIFLVIFFIPICLSKILLYIIVWVIGKIKKDPFATYSYKKRLDYFMINYLKCVKSK